jgi:hypothetical protein
VALPALEDPAPEAPPALARAARAITAAACSAAISSWRVAMRILSKISQRAVNLSSSYTTRNKKSLKSTLHDKSIFVKLFYINLNFIEPPFKKIHMQAYYGVI